MLISISRSFLFTFLYLSTHYLSIIDVLAEEERVRSGAATETSVILVNDIKKVYPSGKYAVKGLSLGIPNGECFGLLGT